MSEKDKNNMSETDKNSMSEKEYQEAKKSSSIIIII